MMGEEEMNREKGGGEGKKGNSTKVTDSLQNLSMS